MNVDTGELRDISELTKVMKESGVWEDVPSKFNEEARDLMQNGKHVDFDGDTPLSQWGRQQHYKSLGAGIPGANRAERRKNAKKRANRRVGI